MNVRPMVEAISLLAIAGAFLAAAFVFGWNLA